MKRTTILWITALLLGWLFDFLFWQHPLGINFFLYVLLCLGGGFLVLNLNGLRPARKSLLLLVPILLFALITFIRQEPLSLFLSFVLTLGLMGLLAVSFLGGRWPSYSLTDYVVQSVRLVGSLLARPLIFLSETRQPAPADAAGAAAGALPVPNPFPPRPQTLLGHPARPPDRPAGARRLRRPALLRRPGLRPAPA